MILCLNIRVCILCYQYIFSTITLSMKSWFNLILFTLMWVLISASYLCIYSSYAAGNCSEVTLTTDVFECLSILSRFSMSDSGVSLILLSINYFVFSKANSYNLSDLTLFLLDVADLGVTRKVVVRHTLLRIIYLQIE